MPATEALTLAEDADPPPGAHIPVRARVDRVHSLREARFTAHGGRYRHELRVVSQPGEA